MYYPDGQEMRLGDKLEMWDGCTGEVVCSFDTDEYGPSYPKEEWAYLKTGVLILGDKTGLIHYVAVEPGFRLTSRA